MRTWPHAPSKVVTAPGTWFLTGGTYQKRHLFHDETRLELLHTVLLESVETLGWDPLAWAVFSNHWHFLGISPDEDGSAAKLALRVHNLAARALNALDAQPKRMVRYRSWNERITFQTSVMARWAYIHFNPVKHGRVTRPEDYPYGSAHWFLSEGDRPFVESVLSFKFDRVEAKDDF